MKRNDDHAWITPNSLTYKVGHKAMNNGIHFSLISCLTEHSATSFQHRHVDARLLHKIDSNVVAGVCMPYNAHTGISSEYPL